MLARPLVLLADLGVNRKAHGQEVQDRAEQEPEGKYRGKAGQGHLRPQAAPSDEQQLRIHERRGGQEGGERRHRHARAQELEHEGNRTVRAQWRYHAEPGRHGNGHRRVVAAGPFEERRNGGVAQPLAGQHAENDVGQKLPRGGGREVQNQDKSTHVFSSRNVQRSAPWQATDRSFPQNASREARRQHRRDGGSVRRSLACGSPPPLDAYLLALTTAARSSAPEIPCQVGNQRAIVWRCPTLLFAEQSGPSSRFP